MSGMTWILEAGPWPGSSHFIALHIPDLATQVLSPWWIGLETCYTSCKHESDIRMGREHRMVRYLDLMVEYRCVFPLYERHGGDGDLWPEVKAVGMESMYITLHSFAARGTQVRSHTCPWRGASEVIAGLQCICVSVRVM